MTGNDWSLILIDQLMLSVLKYINYLNLREKRVMVVVATSDNVQGGIKECNGL